ncbi:alpha/beta fold hydrolase [Streptomyces sp. NPDC102467]|uniref:alpha/beta fold hydrolase n=1 Tax=Streptomyces sp. NPDC102467 TaxID=3366179 RepID=UPI0038073EBB
MIKEHIRTVTVQGVAYTYRVLQPSTPTVEPVILLGGVLEGMHDWAYLEGTVLPRASLVTVDLPGLRSTAFQGADRDDVDTLCVGLEGIIEDLGAPRVNLYGYSLGAAVSFQYAQRRPERVARLLIGGVPDQVTEELVAHLRRATDRARAGDADGFAALMAERLLCLDESHSVHRRELTLGYLQRFMRNAARTPHKVDLLATALTSRHHPLTGGLTGVPTMVFTGEHDHLHPLERQHAFNATIDDSRFVTFPDCDHMLPLQRPEAVTSLVASFLMQEPTAGSSDIADPLPVNGRRAGTRPA